MIRIYYGDDRGRMLDDARKALGETHEVIEGEGLSSSDMVNIFEGATLFTEKRKILLKDLSENKAVFVELPRYIKTENDVVLVENKLDKRSVAYKELVAKKVEMREFKVAEAPEKKLVFDVLDMAMRGDGKRAVELVEKIETAQDPYMFFGLMVTQAIRKMEMGNRKARGVISLLVKTDLLMKSSSLSPWLLVKRLLVLISGI